MLFELASGDLEEFAKQVTIWEHIIFSQIHVSEFMGLAWSKSSRDVGAPNIVKLIAAFNKLSRWVVTSLVSEPKAKTRGILITRLIDLAYNFLYLCNYNGMMAIMAGLESSEIHRLGKSWAKVPMEKLNVYDSIKALISPHKNFFIMRSKLAQAPLPCLPYLGMFLTDLTFAHDSIRDPQGDAVWFGDWMAVGRIILTLRPFQISRFISWSLNTPIQLFIHRYLVVEDEDATYARSLAIEPRK